MKRTALRRRVLFLVATLVVSLVALGRPPGPSYAINGFSDNQELPLPLLAPIGPTGVSFIVRGLEPSTRVAPDGTVYVSTIRGVPGGVDLHRYYAPIDGLSGAGGTYPFKYEGQPDNCGILANGCANNSLDPLGIGLGGGDVDLAVNFPTSGVPNLALVSLTLAPGVTGTHSTDRADHFSPANPVVALIPGDDRQWIEGFGAQNVYLVYHDVATFNIEVQRSNDGGLTYVDGFGEAIDPQTFPAAGGVPATNTANTHGTIRVDRSPTCTLSRGNLYQIFVAPDNVVENAAGGPSRSAYVGVSTDVKLGLPVFTFTDHKIATTPTSISQIFPALAVDAFGYLYAVWSDNSGIFYTYSTDIGTTWAAPIRVNQGTTVGNANVFPWIDADANGHVGIVWFGGDRAGNSNDATIHQPGTDMSTWTNWNVYYAESVLGHTATPAFTQSVISDHVIHRGTLSTGGLGGGANRNLGDYFQIAFDPQHLANVAFSDDSKLSPITVAGHTGNNDPQARRLIRANFTHQLAAAPGIVTSGPCAGTITPPPPETGRKITGGGRLGPDVNFGFVAKETPLNGALSYHDQSQNLDVKSSGGIDSILFSGNCATFKGNAKVNGQPGYRFSVNACDNADPGVGKDTFGIGVTGPNNFVYSKGPAPITEGNISMH